MVSTTQNKRIFDAINILFNMLNVRMTFILFIFIITENFVRGHNR